jgi:hypothetical protein
VALFFCEEIMGVNLKQLPDSSMGLEGKDLGTGSFLTRSLNWTPTSSATAIMLVVPRTVVIQSIVARVETAGSDGGTVTATIYKAPSGTAIGSGVALHSGTINLKGTAATNQTLTLSTVAGALEVAAGSAIGIVFTGTLTAAVGGVTVSFNPA